MEAYCDYRRCVAGGEDPSFEELCAEFPSIAHALRLLHDSGGEEDEPEDMEPFSEDVTAALNQDLPDAAGNEEGLPGEEEVAAAFAAKPLYTAEGDQRFSVRRVLARGVMSVVLEVYDQDLDRTLAMKVMAPSRRERWRARVTRPVGSAERSGFSEKPISSAGSSTPAFSPSSSSVPTLRGTVFSPCRSYTGIT